MKRKPIFLKNPEYHGNPIDKEGSPVTMHWGYDITDFIKDVTGGDETNIIRFDEEISGMKFDIELFITKKK